MRRLLMLPTAIAVAGATALARRHTTRRSQRSGATRSAKEVRTVSREKLPRSPRAGQRTEAGGSIVDEWMRESFPASDPPQSW